MRIVTAAAMLAVIVVSHPANAKPHRHYLHLCSVDGSIASLCRSDRRPLKRKPPIKVTVPETRACSYVDDVHLVCRAALTARLGQGIARTRAGDTTDRVSSSGMVLGSRPAECYRFPATRHLWCGCAAAIDAGLDNRDGFWNLAAHWVTHLAPAEPAPNMAAARYGHVAILKSHVHGAVWLAYDPNSGGGLARLHEIDISRYRIRDPGHPLRVNRFAGA